MGATLYALWGLIRSQILVTGETVLYCLESMAWTRSVHRQIGEIVNQFYICTFKALPVVSLVGAFVGMIVSLQTGTFLRDYGQQAAVGGLNAVSLAREMGPMMTSVILAGLVGSAMAAELGTMKVSEEIDALEVMSINPVRFLLMPRIMALSIACPLLTIYNDVLGFAFGGVVAHTQLAVDPDAYIDWGKRVVDNTDVYSGLFKAWIFGLVVATISCSEGLHAEGGALGVGRATRTAVVKSFLAIVIFDYFFASLFTRFVY